MDILHNALLLYNFYIFVCLLKMIPLELLLKLWFLKVDTNKEWPCLP